MLFIDSLLAALSPFTLAMNFVGVMLGMIVGALPGLGSVVAITICLPFTFGMTSVSAIALLLGAAGKVGGKTHGCAVRGRRKGCRRSDSLFCFLRIWRCLWGTIRRASCRSCRGRRK